ncbi:MAG: MBOAT family protein [Intestinibacter sp.]|uniref:MBOAT family O-acyltransferase n=1 Tax=Intestinibacter sp. TaxID=1965304 RepID=UPI002A7EAB88|nr:MBOAT family protein [Intestinibacter sp.]MDY4573600.1 MBOAT family protein [Intestinibacter sp.]
MLFSSTIFVFLFLPMVLIFYYGIFRNKRKLQNIFLLLASLFFYAWGEPAFVLIMLLSIISNYYFGLKVDEHREDKKKSKSIIVLMLIFNLSIMFIFKYLMFTLSNIKYLTGLNFNIPNIALPIGISFFTFQAISYVIDVYRQNGKVQKNPLYVGLYISFFPQLIAGPIVRYETISEQIENRQENFEDFSKGVCRFIIGLGKKMLLANTLAIVADYAFSLKASELSVCMAWLGAIAYTFQIFFDFSGYSDMAIGLGQMFGFKFLENFNYPYISKSISEFWRRWHISLGTWFRDYVYFPLGGSRVDSKKRLVFNLFVVWSLTGLWHGANWTFIVWGLLYFVLITFEKLTGFDKKLGWFGHIYTMLFVTLGWVLFRSDNIMYGIEYIKSMFAMNGNVFMDSLAKLYFLENRYFYIGAILFSLPLKNIISKKLNLDNKVFDLLYIIIILILFVLSICYIVKGSYNPFIYFNF